MTIKLLILAVFFIISGGAFFSEYFKEHKFISLLAMVVATIATFYLLQDIYQDIIDDLKQASSSSQPPNVVTTPQSVPYSSSSYYQPNSSTQPPRAPVVVTTPKVESFPPVQELPSRGWYVILGSYPQNNHGKKLTNRRFNWLNSEGFNVFVTNSNWYRNFKNGLWVVLMGPYNKNTAEAKLKTAKRFVPDTYKKRW